VYLFIIAKKDSKLLILKINLSLEKTEKASEWSFNSCSCVESSVMPQAYISTQHDGSLKEPILAFSADLNNNNYATYIARSRMDTLDNAPGFVVRIEHNLQRHSDDGSRTKQLAFW